MSASTSSVRIWSSALPRVRASCRDSSARAVARSASPRAESAAGLAAPGLDQQVRVVALVRVALHLLEGGERGVEAAVLELEPALAVQHLALVARRAERLHRGDRQRHQFRGLFRPVKQAQHVAGLALAHGDQRRPGVGARRGQRAFAPLERGVEIAEGDEALRGVGGADHGLAHLAAALAEHVRLEVVPDRLAQAVHLRRDRRQPRFDPGAHAVAAILAGPQLVGDAAGGGGRIDVGDHRPAARLRGLQAHRVGGAAVVLDGAGHGLVELGHAALLGEDRGTQPGRVATADGVVARREAGGGLVAPGARAVVVAVEQRDLALDEAQPGEVLRRRRVRAAGREKLPGLAAEIPRARAVALAQLPRELDAGRQPVLDRRSRQARLDLPQLGGGRELLDRQGRCSDSHLWISVFRRRT
jgi:hypothetical protein